MKIILAMLFGVLSVESAFALPVLNLNKSASPYVTMNPDSVDPNLYYVAPNSYVIAKDAGGTPQFSYVEIANFWDVKALVQAVMEAGYNGEEITKAQTIMLAANRNARFTGIPFAFSAVKFDTLLAPFVENNDCNHAAGTVGAEEACSFTLSNKGRMALRERLKLGLTLSMDFNYTVMGVYVDEKGNYQPKTQIFSVAGIIGGAELAGFPQLFTDSNGHVIDFKTADPH